MERGERERDVDWIVGGNLRGEMMRRGRGGVGEEERDRGYVDDEKMSKLVKEKLVSLLPRSNYQTLQPTKPPPPRMPPPIFKPTPPQPPPPPPKLPTPTSSSPQPPPSPPHPPPPPPSPLAAATSPSAHSLYTPGS